MARTNYISMIWWWWQCWWCPLCTRPTQSMLWGSNKYHVFSLWFKPTTTRTHDLTAFEARNANHYINYAVTMNGRKGVIVCRLVCTLKNMDQTILLKLQGYCHDFVTLLTVTECLCYIWPRICSICGTDDHGYVPFVLHMTTDMFHLEM
jgi:hypothetical protein